MGSKSRFESLVERVPVDNDKLIGQAVSWFIMKQEPENVSFKSYKDGYAIQVRVDEDGRDQAREFWNENVHTHLQGEE